MTDTTKPVEPVAIVNDLMACDVGMITLPFGYGTVRKRIRQAITALDAANAEIERLTKERDEALAIHDHMAELRDEDGFLGTVEDWIKDVLEDRSNLQNETERLRNPAAWDIMDITWADLREKVEAESTALVAAAYADIAERADLAANQYEDAGNANAALALRLQAAGIRSQTLADATAALEAYGAAKVREGWEACLVQYEPFIQHKRNCNLMRAFIEGKECNCGLAAIKEKQP